MPCKHQGTSWLANAERVSSAFASSHGNVIDRLQTLKDQGFTTLAIPVENGGKGARWPQIVAVVREIAAGDSAAGTLLGYHTFNVAHLRLAPQTRSHFERLIVEQQWWLAGIANPLDDDMRFTRHGDGWQVSGFKTFCTGAAIADRLKITGLAEDGQTRLSAMIPRSREGVRYGDDWDHLGLADTFSGSITLDAVQVFPDEVINQSQASPGDFPWHGLVTPLNQSIFTNLYLGYAIGALRAAKAYTREYSRAWVHSGVQRAQEDRLLIQQYGELWSALQAAIALADQAAEHVQQLLDTPPQLEPFLEQRGQAAVTVAAARIQASRIALDLTSRIYELMGARATANRFGFDRFWRDTRTMTLHDPIAYKIQEIGDYFLNDHFPEIKAYT